MTIPNNQKELAEKINGLELVGVDATYDDGNVGVRVSGAKERIQEVANVINDKFGHYRVGDGVQEGDIYVNGQELSDVIHLA
jgi:acylphosphatase